MMKLWRLCAIALAAVLSAPPAQAETAVIHHTATVRIDPDRAHLYIDDTLVLQGHGATNLILSPAFTVKTATVNGKPATMRRDGDALTVGLNGPGPHEVKLSYQGQGAPLLSPDGGFVEASWLAQPAGALATWSIAGQTPADQKFIVPGKLLSETQTNKVYQAHFENNTPNALPVLITGPFQVAEKMLGDIRLRTYFHGDLVSLADGYLESTARYIEYYIDKVGPYPYPGFSIISGPAPVGWGLPGMTYMGKRVLALPFIRDTSLPHEILHNWWGNAVEVDYRNGNWAEGLTTYQADHAIAELRKPGGGPEKRFEWLRNYAALPSERDHALTAFRSKTHDASQVVGYGKTAFVFHMLNIKLGQNGFDKAIQRFARVNLWKTASWSDIQAAFEAESGQDLTAFFQAWIERPGAPDLKLTNAKADGNVVRFSLHQTQDGPAYPLTLPLTLETENGIEHHTITMVNHDQSYVLTNTAPARTLHIDPNTDVFRRLSPNEAPPILRDMTLDTNARLLALGDQSMRAAAQGLTNALLQTRVRLGVASAPIIVGPTKEVRAHLARKGLPQAPQSIASAGNARAWTVRTGDGLTLLVVEAEDVGALQALTRVLPHYKRRSYVVMENGKTIDKGAWAPGPGSLTVRLD